MSFDRERKVNIGSPALPESASYLRMLASNGVMKLNKEKFVGAESCSHHNQFHKFAPPRERKIRTKEFERDKFLARGTCNFLSLKTFQIEADGGT